MFTRLYITIFVFWLFWVFFYKMIWIIFAAKIISVPKINI